MEAEDKPLEENVFVVVKSEYIDHSVDIKIEPPDEVDSYPEIENVTVKIEPNFYASEDEPDTELAVTHQSSPQRPVTPMVRQLPIRNKRKARRQSDEDYVPNEGSKKKGKELVKKTYTTKAKREENNYSEEVTKHIEVVTISEEERLQEFKELWHSRQHMRYTCGLCAVGYVMMEPYALHMKLHSPESGEHVCDICHCRARTADVLYRHRLRHHRRYRCALCRSQHKDKETAASHVMSQHAGRAFTCTQCDKGFKRPAYLKKHVAQQHTKSEQVECPVCQRIFHDRVGLRAHSRTHNVEARSGPTQSVVCDTCSRRFRSKGSLRRHLAVHREHRALRCDLCAAVYKSRKGLRLHREKIHLQLVQHEHAQCALCPRVCTTPALLRLHVRRMHSDRSKKYQCDHCKRHYYSKGEVRSHITWSHARTADNVHACACGRVFRTRARLRQHEDARHRLLAPPRDHVCHCGKGFTSKQVLSRHMKSHLGLTYPCPECGLRFKSESYVKVHHKLRHLNMTRAEIKAEKQPRQLAYVTGMRPMHADKSVSKKERRRKKAKKEQAKEEISEEMDFRVPLFDFVDLKREVDE